MSLEKKLCSQCNAPLQPAMLRCRSCGTAISAEKKPAAIGSTSDSDVVNVTSAGANKVKVGAKNVVSSQESSSHFMIDDLLQMAESANKSKEPIEPPPISSLKKSSELDSDSSLFDMSEFSGMLESAEESSEEKETATSLDRVTEVPAPRKKKQNPPVPELHKPVGESVPVVTKARRKPKAVAESTSSDKSEKKAAPKEVASKEIARKKSVRSRSRADILQVKSEKQDRRTVKRAIDDAVNLKPPSFDVPKDATGKKTKSKFNKKVFSKAITQLEEIQFENSKESLESTISIIKKLGEMESPEVVDSLVPFLKDTRPGVPEITAHSLAKARSIDATEPLLRKLETVEEGKVVPFLHALEVQADYRSVGPMIAFGALNSMHSFRIESLVVGMGRPAIPLLIDLLHQSKNKSTILSILSCLGKFKDREATKSIIEISKSKSSKVRQKAIEALGEIGDHQAVRCFVQALGDPKPNVRATAAKSLGLIKEESMIKPLARATKDPDIEVRIQAAIALGEIGNLNAAVALESMLQSDSQREVLAACEALCKFGDSKAIHKIVQLLSAPENESEVKLQMELLDSLRRVREKAAPAVDSILEFLDLENEQLRRKSIEVLGQIGDASASEAIEVCLIEDESEQVRMTAAKALGEIGDHESFTALSKALEDTMNVRTKAIIALGRLKQDAAISTLTTFLFDPSPEIRYQAMMALVEIGKPASAHQIVPLVVDDDEMVSRGAFRALEKLGDKRPEKEILKAAKKRTKGTVASKGSSFSFSELLENFVPYRTMEIFSPSTREGQTALGTLAGTILVAFGLTYYFFFSAAPTTVLVRGFVSSVSVSPEGNIAAGTTRGLLEVWPPKASRPDQISVGNAEIFDVAYGTGESVWVAIGDTIYAVENKIKTPVSQLGSKNVFLSLEASPDRKTICAFDKQKNVYLFDSNSKKEKGVVSLSSLSRILAVSVSNDSIFVTDGSKIVSQVDNAGELIKTFTVQLVSQKDGVRSIATSPDGKTLAVGTVMGNIQLWDIEKGQVTKQLKQDLKEGARPAAIARLWYTPSKKDELFSFDSQLRLWDVAAGTSKNLPRLGGVEKISCSLDGQLLAISTVDDSAVQLINVTTGKRLKPLDYLQ